MTRRLWTSLARTHGEWRYSLCIRIFTALRFVAHDLRFASYRVLAPLIAICEEACRTESVVGQPARSRHKKVGPLRRGHSLGSKSSGGQLLVCFADHRFHSGLSLGKSLRSFIVTQPRLPLTLGLSRYSLCACASCSERPLQFVQSNYDAHKAIGTPRGAPMMSQEDLRAKLAETAAQFPFPQGEIERTYKRRWIF